jgi:hypothetical protein
MPIRVDAELTIQLAANNRNVSCPYLIGPLADEKIPFHLVGSHRGIKLTDLFKYKHQADAGRREAFRKHRRVLGTWFEA